MRAQSWVRWYRSAFDSVTGMARLDSALGLAGSDGWRRIMLVGCALSQPQRIRNWSRLSTRRSRTRLAEAANGWFAVKGARNAVSAPSRSMRSTHGDCGEDWTISLDLT